MLTQTPHIECSQIPIPRSSCRRSLCTSNLLSVTMPLISSQKVFALLASNSTVSEERLTEHRDMLQLADNLSWTIPLMSTVASRPLRDMLWPVCDLWVVTGLWRWSRRCGQTHVHPSWPHFTRALWQPTDDKSFSCVSYKTAKCCVTIANDLLLRYIFFMKIAT